MVLGCVKMKIEVPDRFNFQLKNDKLKFLILIREEDKVKKFYLFNYSMRDFLLANKKKLPGDLDLISFDDIDKNEVMKDYIIESNPIPYQLYIKLNSSDIYVSAETYEIKHFLARQNELKNIFVVLGAKSIKFNIKNSKSNSIETSISAGVNSNVVGLGQEIGVSKSTDNSVDSSNTLTFDHNEYQIKNVNYKTFESSDYYFLPKEIEWQKMIIRRLEHSQLTEKYVLKNNLNLKIKASVKSNFKIANVGFAHGSENLDSLEISYEVEYYPKAKSEYLNDKNDVLDDKVLNSNKIIDSSSI